MLVRPDSPALTGHAGVVDADARRQDRTAPAANNASAIVSLSPEGLALASRTADAADQEVVFKLDGRVVGRIGSDGAAFSDSELGLLAASAGDDPGAVAAHLRMRFGSRIEVQTFTPGHQPAPVARQLAAYRQ